jgi:hypothetical protein
MADAGGKQDPIMATEADITADYFTTEDKVLVFTVYQADGVTVQDLANFTALSWMLKRRLTDADSAAIIEKTLASGAIVITDAPNGICQVTLGTADIDTVAANILYYHELKRTDSPKTVLSYGRFSLQQAVHKSA